MSSLRSLFVAGIFALFCTLSAGASGLKLYLVTVSPGPTLLDAFGHTMLVAVDPANPTGASFYEYGTGIDSSSILAADGMDILERFLDMRLLAKTRKAMNRHVDPVTGLPDEITARYLADPEEYREVRVDVLDLDEAQTKAFLENLESDMARHFYIYENYTNNCATRFRDLLYSDDVLGKTARLAFTGTSDRPHLINTSLGAIAMDSIDDAVKLSRNQKVTIFTPREAQAPKIKQALGFMSMLRIQTEFHSSKEFVATIYTLKELAQGTSMEKKIDNYFFRDSISKAPVQEYKSIFTPARLREALARTQNDATHRYAVDGSASVILKSVAKPVAATPVIVPATPSVPLSPNAPTGSVDTGSDAGSADPVAQPRATAKAS